MYRLSISLCLFLEFIDEGLTAEQIDKDLSSLGLQPEKAKLIKQFVRLLYLM